MRFKYCNHCQKWHEWDELGLWWFGHRQRWDTRCKAYKNRKRRERYRANLAHERARCRRWKRENPNQVKAQRLKYADNNRQQKDTTRNTNIDRYKEIFGDYCKLCREQHSWHRYEMHHLDPGKKTRVVNFVYPWESIEEEIWKCILLCANCHKDVHQ